MLGVEICNSENLAQKPCATRKADFRGLLPDREADAAGRNPEILGAGS